MQLNKIVVLVSCSIFLLIAILLISNKESDIVTLPTVQEERGEEPLLESKASPVIDEKISDLKKSTALMLANKDYEEAVRVREAAEAALNALEKSVSDLEKRVDVIEQSGGDPVDFQNELLQDFQKVFINYQDAELQLSNAEKMEEQALLLLREEQVKLNQN